MKILGLVVFQTANNVSVNITEILLQRIRGVRLYWNSIRKRNV